MIPATRCIDFETQVRCGIGIQNHAAAVTVAKRLAEAGRWDGQGVLIVHRPCAARYMLEHGLDARDLIAGFDFEARPTAESERA